MPKVLRFIGFITLCLVTSLLAQPLELDPAVRISDAEAELPAGDGQAVLENFGLPKNLTASLWAAEPLLANPVALSFDDQGRLFVAETNRYRTSVLDVRDYPEMFERDLASRTLEDRARLIEEAFGESTVEWAGESESVRLIEDTNGDGVADTSHVFATGFNALLDGMVGGILAWQNRVWLANVPSLWKLTPDASGIRAAGREEVLRGFGVHLGFTGHDLHGPIIGPDGKLYFSVGDRGAHIAVTDVNNIDLSDTGAIFRCNPDGRQLEVVATGFRNPADLAFDEFGNLFTVDSGSDNGDPARLVYVVEGTDSGRRIGYQGTPFSENQSAAMLHPVSDIKDGPTGLAYYPGTGLTKEYKRHFFLSHFKDSLRDSGILTYSMRPKGAGFEVVDSRTFLREAHPTDVTFGPDNRLYFSDWVSGWPKSGRGRIYAVEALLPEVSDREAAEETTRLIEAGMKDRQPNELGALLGHADQRVRLAAQFELAERGQPSLTIFQNVAENRDTPRLGRLHALWGIGQLADGVAAAMNSFPTFLKDEDSEVRAQAAKLIGDTLRVEYFGFLLAALQDPEPRVAFFAAQSLGKLKRKAAIPALIQLLRGNDDQDAFLRHAVVIALSRLGPDPALANTVYDPSRAVRLGGLLAFRRLQDPAVALFLEDFDPSIVREAARAINDQPITEALPTLAALLEVAPLDDEALVFRALNAHFRLGQPENAQALADFAGQPYVPAAFRSAALEHLANWASPSARDRLTGLYLPLPQRNPEPAIQAVGEFLSQLTGKTPVEVQIATIHAIAELGVSDKGHALWDVVYQNVHPLPARIAALRALEKLADLRLEVAAQTAGRSKDSKLRLAALPILARFHPAVSLPTFTFIASKGSAIEQRMVFSYLGEMDDPRADEILLQALDRLAAGELPVAAQAELLTAAMARANPQVSKKAIQIQDDWSVSADRLAPYRSALDGGNPLKGRSVFETHPVVTCTQCHEPGKVGREAGPSLAGIGKDQTREELLESIVFPSAKITPGFELVKLTLRNSDSETGIVLNENEVALELRRNDGTRVAIPKTQISGREPLPSSMPENFGEALTRAELRDLIAFLSDLQDPPESSF